MLNIGVDFGMKNRIITGTVEYYHKKGTDLIGDASLPASTGLLNTRGNFSDMKGHGVDITLNSININTSFQWTTTFLFSYTTDKVTKYTGVNSGLYALIPGKPVQGLYSYRWGGLDPSTGDPLGYLADTVTKDYGSISSLPLNERVYSGHAQPVIFGALRNTFSWRGFTLSANITYKRGYYFRRDVLSYSNLFYSWYGNKEFVQRWQKPGDEKTTNVPSMIYPADYSRDNFYAGSEITVDKGDFIRLQDINISYDIDKSQYEKLPLTHFQVYVYLNNLGIIWKANKHDLDPDNPTGYPAPFTASFGVKANF
jgi:hypothetical protein